MAVENTSRERFGYTDAEGNRVSALRDMLDGGGRGQRGDRFEGGGLLSSFGNALGGPGGRARGQGFGYTDAAGNVVSPGIDMINGGGRGRAGSQFEGGLLSAVLNSLGVRPYGYVDPEQAITAGMDETAPSLMASPAAPTRPTMRPPQPVGMDGMPALTADQIRILREMGIDVGGMEGEPASHSELAALLRSPGALLSMDNPSVPRPYAPQNPGATIQPDGSSMPRYDVPTTSGVNMGQSDIGTVRPFTSRVPTRMPMQGF